jgi:hypothetical protein
MLDRDSEVLSTKNKGVIRKGVEGEGRGSGRFDFFYDY